MQSLTEWVPIPADRNPQVGDTTHKVPEVREDVPGGGFQSRLDDLGVCVGTIIQIGAHWSEPGRSGWWCLVEYDTPEYHRWCEHYGYDPASDTAAQDYRRYLEERDVLARAFNTSREG